LQTIINVDFIAGLYPDVGETYFVLHLRGCLGIFLALTGMYICLSICAYNLDM